jgi:hypothetical protein
MMHLCFVALVSRWVSNNGLLSKTNPLKAVAGSSRDSAASLLLSAQTATFRIRCPVRGTSTVSSLRSSPWDHGSWPVLRIRANTAAPCRPADLRSSSSSSAWLLKRRHISYILLSLSYRLNCTHYLGQLSKTRSRSSLYIERFSANVSCKSALKKHRLPLYHYTDYSCVWQLASMRDN